MAFRPVAAPMEPKPATGCRRAFGCFWGQFPLTGSIFPQLTLDRAQNIR